MFGWIHTTSSKYFKNFLKIFLLPKILYLKFFGKSWGSLYIHFLVLVIKFHFTYGKWELCQNVKKSKKNFSKLVSRPSLQANFKLVFKNGKLFCQIEVATSPVFHCFIWKLKLITVFWSWGFWLICKNRSDKSIQWILIIRILGIFRMGLFWAAHRWGWQKAPFPKICHTYPTIMKLGTVIPYLKKIHKMYESSDAPLEFCWHQNFFTRNQQILLYQEIQI